MYDCVDQGDANSQKTIAEQATEKVILFARAQMHQLCEIIKHKEKWGQNGKQPGIISVT